MLPDFLVLNIIGPLFLVKFIEKLPGIFVKKKTGKIHFISVELV